MSTPNADRTHCVTFNNDGRRYFAVRSREYGDQVPMGITNPEVRCAMSESDATRMANFLIKESVNFTNIKVVPLNVKRKA